MTRSGTNLLGLVKHITYGEIEYLGETFSRPAADVRLPWWEPDNVHKTLETSGDMYAAPGESTSYIVGFYKRACANADQGIVELDLEVIGTLPRSGEKFTLRQALVHVIQEPVVTPDMPISCASSSMDRSVVRGKTPGSPIPTMTGGGPNTGDESRHQRPLLSSEPDSSPPRPRGI